MSLPTTSPGFIHLNCHSAYSLLEGALPLAALVKLAAADAMPALGVTDTANLFGALEFAEKAAGAGIQPIIGCKLPVRFEAEPELDPRRAGQKPGRRAAPLVLLAQTDAGYRALMKLVTGFYLGRGGGSEPVPLDDVAAAASGLIAMTGGHDGALYPLVAAGEMPLAEARLAALGRAFGD